MMDVVVDLGRWFGCFSLDNVGLVNRRESSFSRWIFLVRGRVLGWYFPCDIIFCVRDVAHAGNLLVLAPRGKTLTRRFLRSFDATGCLGGFRRVCVTIASSYAVLIAFSLGIQPCRFEGGGLVVR